MAFERLERRQLLSLTIDSELPLRGEYAYSTQPTLALHGHTDNPSTESVFVSGQRADWLARDGAWWSSDRAILNPGINRVIVETYGEVAPDGQPLESQFIDVWYDGPGTPAKEETPPQLDGQLAPRTVTAGTIDHNAILVPQGGPYHVVGDVVVGPGARLTIWPGTTVYFDPGVELRVEGELVARGSKYARIRLTSVPNAAKVPDQPAGTSGLPDGPPRWRGIHFVGSMAPDNAIAFADIEYAQDPRGSIGVTRSNVTIENVTFRGTHLPMVYANSSSLLVRDSEFPDMFGPAESPARLGLDNSSEHIKAVGDIPDGGQFIIEGNRFGTNKGHNDVIDVVGGNRPRPIVQVLDNVFLGTGDEHLDLGGDAYVAGNLFMNVAKDEDNHGRRYANAISTGDGRAGSTIVAVRNIFWDVDHAIHLRNGDSTIFENNTVVRVHEDFVDPAGNRVINSAIHFYIDVGAEKPGGGALVSNSIFQELPRIFGAPDLPLGRTTPLEAHHNLIDHLLAQDAIGSRQETVVDLGLGNIVGEPQFTDVANGQFALRPDSPGKGAGTWGQDMGAAVRAGAWISGEPAAITDKDRALLKIGGPGIFAVKYRLDGGAWSNALRIGSGLSFEITAARSATVEITDLPSGSHLLEAVGQDFAGRWQAEPTFSRPWVVASSGDANLDGHFDRQDIVLVLQAGQYASGQAADWREGDWNRDGQFDQHDIIAALRTGRFSESAF